MTDDYQIIPAQTLEAREIASNSVDLIECFISTYDRGPRTRDTYRRNLRAWTRYLDSQGLNLLEANRQTVIDFRDYKYQVEKLKASTVNAYLTAVRRLYKWLEGMRVYPNIAAEVNGLKRSKHGAKDALTKEQARHLLKAKPETMEQMRNYAIVSLMIRAGLRTVEVTRADYGDIRQQSGGLILLVQGKGYTSKEDYVLLTNEAAAPIWRYLDARRETGETLKDDTPLFASVGNRNHGGRMSTRTVSRIVKDALEHEGIGSARLTAHSLRHTAVTFALEGGASLQSAQAMARHASINTTMIYAHNLDRMANAAERNIETYLAS